jgi:hypothetical protein
VALIIGGYPYSLITLPQFGTRQQPLIGRNTS